MHSPEQAATVAAALHGDNKLECIVLCRCHQFRTGHHPTEAATSAYPPPSSLVVVSLHFSFSALEARSESHDTLEGWTAVSKLPPWRSPRSDSGPARKAI